MGHIFAVQQQQSGAANTTEASMLEGAASSVRSIAKA